MTQRELIDVRAIVGYLGKPVSDVELKTVFSRFDIELSNNLRLPEGEYRTYIECPEQGISFVFTDEAIFLGRGSQAIGTGDLYFSGAFLYSEGKDRYKQYISGIPLGISFNMERAELINKLGSPSWSRPRSDGSIAADRWDSLEKYRVHITYAKETTKPVLISVNLGDGH